LSTTTTSVLTSPVLARTFFRHGRIQCAWFVETMTLARSCKSADKRARTSEAFVAPFMACASRELAIGKLVAFVCDPAAPGERDGVVVQIQVSWRSLEATSLAAGSPTYAWIAARAGHGRVQLTRLSDARLHEGARSSRRRTQSVERVMIAMSSR
jgi:hypothetical protein